MDKKPRLNKNGWDQILKHLGEERPLTTFEVSKICGVVHSTVTNWIEENKLVAYKTPGGHRRIKKDDLSIFLKLYEIPIPKELHENLQSGFTVTEDTGNSMQTNPLTSESAGKSLHNEIRDDVYIESREAGPSAKTNGKKRILIVEDDQAVSESIVQTLKNVYPGFEIIQAFDGYEAGKQIAKSPPDLLLLDLILPGVDGFKILKNIRQDKNCYTTKIIAITGYDTMENRERILQSGGVDGFVSKPINLNKLKITIETLLFDSTLNK